MILLAGLIGLLILAVLAWALTWLPQRPEYVGHHRATGRQTRAAARRLREEAA